jgi:hypothetical protein
VISSLKGTQMTKKPVADSFSYILETEINRLIEDELENNPVRKESLRFWLNNVRAIQTTLDLLNVKIENVLHSC